MKLILASASPRRADLLRQVGIPFSVVKPDLTEYLEVNLSPEELVTSLALKKALIVSDCISEGFVLAADTIVVHRGAVLGKPTDRKDARWMLRLLSGREHEVLTGLTLIDASSGKCESGICATKVWMKPLHEKEINAYVSTGEPLDKAGAYAIQGRAALLIERIEGCYFNVVGLPLGLLYELLKRMQLPIWLNGKDSDYAKGFDYD